MVGVGAGVVGGGGLWLENGVGAGVVGGGGLLPENGFGAGVVGGGGGFSLSLLIRLITLPSEFLRDDFDAAVPLSGTIVTVPSE